ncbi:MAG: type II secretion system F family protein [Bdellovibrionota bacterium]
MSDLRTYLMMLFCGASIAGTGYLLYPWLEQLIINNTQTYVAWAMDVSEKMFRPRSKTWITTAIAFPTICLALTGAVLTKDYPIICIFFTVAFGMFGFFSLRMVLQFQFERRIQLFNEQLIDALTLMSNSLKSGMNLSQSIQIIIQEFPNPISQEFGLVLSQEKIGLTIDEALEKMLERIPSQDLSVAIHSILILRETGGDLSETFETIAQTIRERKKVSGKIKAMTQQGRTQGIGLLIIPFALMLLMYWVNPPMIIPMFTTQLGWIMIAMMLILQTLGALWIWKIVTIEV